jgi:hypothetical protein
MREPKHEVMSYSLRLWVTPPIQRALMQPRNPGVESLDYENHEQGDRFGGRLACFDGCSNSRLFSKVPTSTDTCRQIYRQVPLSTDKYREVPIALDSKL